MSSERHEQIITPQSGWLDLGLWELWAHQQLLWTLVKRDLQVRYKNTVLGIIWVVLQPALSTLIFTLILARVFGLEASGGNYLVYTLIGFTCWQFFSGCVGAATGSVYEQAGMLRKVYFPRAYIPLTIVFRQLFDYGVASIFLVLVMWWQGVPFTLTGLTAYLGITVNLLLWASGLGLAVSGLAVLYRDVRHLIPFVIQIWFYLTPIFYNRGLLTGRLQYLALLNPITSILDVARAGMLQGEILWTSLLGQFICGLLIALAGLAFFRHLETEIIDKA